MFPVRREGIESMPIPPKPSNMNMINAVWGSFFLIKDSIMATQMGVEPIIKAA